MCFIVTCSSWGWVQWRAPPLIRRELAGALMAVQPIAERTSFAFSPLPEPWHHVCHPCPQALQGLAAFSPTCALGRHSGSGGGGAMHHAGAAQLLPHCATLPRTSR